LRLGRSGLIVRVALARWDGQSGRGVSGLEITDVHHADGPVCGRRGLFFRFRAIFGLFLGRRDGTKGRLVPLGPFAPTYRRLRACVRRCDGLF